MLDLFGVPAALLPEVKDSSAAFGTVDPSCFGGAVPIGGIAGDQQAALVGEACFNAGQAKSTYGTGCFLMLNTGDELIISKNRLLTTMAYRIGGKPCYALEGSIFIAGAVVQWLRDGLGIIRSSAEVEGIAGQRPDSRGVYLVPAFTGLGAPHWDPAARGALLGLTRDSDITDVVTAALESVCYQTRDLLEAMKADNCQLLELRVDGGMAVNDLFMQRLADLTGVPALRPRVTETTALGAAFLAGLQVGVYESLADVGEIWEEESVFRPAMDAQRREGYYQGWNDALRRVKSAS